jgi:mRNA (guanine-N7-)-methyltransferase
MLERHNSAHYNAMATAKAYCTKAQRARGPLYPLKKHHNTIKRDLLKRYASNAGTLLDIGCGRGGDMQKWSDNSVQYAKGLDISTSELEEARSRYALNRHLIKTRCEFAYTDVLGKTEWVDADNLKYDVISAMFCIHYFFWSEEALESLLKTVEKNLRQGGVFIGCAPDGKVVRNWVMTGKSKRCKWLHIDPMWTGENVPGAHFGHAYGFSLSDTVTSNPRAPPIEFLVDFNELIRRAEAHGMWLVESKPFQPTTYPKVSDDIAQISTLFRTFVFVKTTQ